MFDTLSDKNIIFFPEKGFFSSWDFILKQWRRGQHWRKLKVRFRFTETPFLPNHRTLPKPCFCRTSKPKPKFRSYTNFSSFSRLENQLISASVRPKQEFPPKPKPYRNRYTFAVTEQTPSRNLTYFS